MFFIREINFKNNKHISYETIKLARWIFKNFFGKLPVCKNINIMLQHKIAEIQTLKTIKHTDFEFIIKLSSGQRNIKGKFYYIPLKRNIYFDKNKGELCNSCQFNFKNNKLVSVTLYKKKQIILPKLNDITISMDIGLNILFADNYGNCYGKYFLKKIKKFDKHRENIVKKLKLEHGNKVKLSLFKEYTDYTQMIKDFTKNEINRLLNKIYRKHKPIRIVVENLDFKGSNIGKKNNRLLCNFGLGYITSKLEQLKANYGVVISYIDAAYSSQTCSKCHYVDSNNRKEQSKFECKCCGKKINADVNAGKTLNYFFERFKEKKFYNTADRTAKRTLLVEDFIDNQKVWMNNKRIIQVTTIFVVILICSAINHRKYIFLCFL